MLIVAGCTTTASESGGDTEQADASEKADSAPTGALPEATGEFGEGPEFSWPSADPSGELQVEVLEEGSGPAVEEGSVVSAHYAGHVWGEKEPFDSSYERNAPSVFPLNGVVDGWSEGIPGNSVGSRLLISIPPELGYGPEGNPAAGIGGEDTIVFVVDVVDAFAVDAFGEPDADPIELPEEAPFAVEGALGKAPSIDISADSPEPSEPRAFPLSEGSGPAVESGQSAVVSYTLTSWDNEITESSWMEELGPNAGPQVISVGGGTALDLLEGFEVGSRVALTQIPTQEMPAVVIVADILAAF